MANGNVEQLANFLNQLPQLMQRRRSLDLDERRLDLFQEQQRNTIENQQRIREENRKTQFLREFTTLYNSLEGSPDARAILLKQHPYMKDNPQIAETFEREIEAKELLSQQVSSLFGMEPEDGILTARTLSKNKYVNPAQLKTIREYISESEDKLTTNLTEVKNTPAYQNYIIATNKYEAIRENRPVSTNQAAMDAYEKRLMDAITDVTTSFKEAQVQAKGMENVGAFPKPPSPIGTGTGAGTGTGTGTGAGIKTETGTGAPTKSLDQPSLDDENDLELIIKDIYDEDDGALGGIDTTNPFTMSIINPMDLGQGQNPNITIDLRNNPEQARSQFLQRNSGSPDN